MVFVETLRTGSSGAVPWVKATDFWATGKYMRDLIGKYKVGWVPMMVRNGVMGPL